ncbi:hypothetical protein MRX96_030014 [Rhipicephalus microplus]
MRSSDVVLREVAFCRGRGDLSICQGVMEPVRGIASRTPRFSQGHALLQVVYRRDSNLTRVTEPSRQLKPKKPYCISYKLRRLQGTPQRGSHRGELQQVLSLPRTRGRRSSSGCSNVFSKVHLHEHSGGGDWAGESECSQRQVTAFKPRDFPVNSVGVVSAVIRPAILPGLPPTFTARVDVFRCRSCCNAQQPAGQ